METTTYSFLDTSCVIAHPLLPSAAIVITGEGAGKAVVSMKEDKSVIDVSADGSPMVSKIAGNVGSISIDVQQTSRLHKELLALYNKVNGADTSMWANAAITLRNITDFTGHIATGVSFQKVPDKGYDKQGAMITWVFLCADIQHLVS